MVLYRIKGIRCFDITLLSVKELHWRAPWADDKALNKECTQRRGKNGCKWEKAKYAVLVTRFWKVNIAASTGQHNHMMWILSNLKTARIRQRSKKKENWSVFASSNLLCHLLLTCHLLHHAMFLNNQRARMKSYWCGLTESVSISVAGRHGPCNKTVALHLYLADSSFNQSQRSSSPSLPPSSYSKVVHEKA